MTCSNVITMFEDFTTLLAFKGGETEFMNGFIGVEFAGYINSIVIANIADSIFGIFIDTPLYCEKLFGKADRLYIW